MQMKNANCWIANLMVYVVLYFSILLTFFNALILIVGNIWHFNYLQEANCTLQYIKSQYALNGLLKVHEMYD